MSIHVPSMGQLSDRRSLSLPSPGPQAHDSLANIMPQNHNIEKCDDGGKTRHLPYFVGSNPTKPQLFLGSFPGFIPGRWPSVFQLICAEVSYARQAKPARGPLTGPTTGKSLGHGMGRRGSSQKENPQRGFVESPASGFGLMWIDGGGEVDKSRYNQAPGPHPMEKAQMRHGHHPSKQERLPGRSTFNFQICQTRSNPCCHYLPSLQHVKGWSNDE